MLLLIQKCIKTRFTVKLWFRDTVLQRFLQADTIFVYQRTMSAIKFRKRLPKFMITIGLPKMFDSKGFVTTAEVIKV